MVTIPLLQDLLVQVNILYSAYERFNINRVSKNYSYMIHGQIKKTGAINPLNRLQKCIMQFDMFYDTLYNKSIVNNLWEL